MDITIILRIRKKNCVLQLGMKFKNQTQTQHRLLTIIVTTHMFFENEYCYDQFLLLSPSLSG